MEQLQSEDDGPSRPLFFEHEGNRAIRDGDWKLVALRGQPWELYDFAKNRTEMEDVSKYYGELVQSLAKKWETWAAENQVTPLPEDYEVNYLRKTTTVEE